MPQRAQEERPGVPRAGVEVSPPAGIVSRDAGTPVAAESVNARAERLVAVLVCMIVAARFPLHQALTLGIVAGVALLPVWLGALRRYRLAPTIVCLGTFALASGVALSALHRPTHTVSTSLQQIHSLVLVSLVSGIGVLLWARSVLGTRRVAIWFGLGLVVSIALSGGGTDNPWKYTLSIPAIVLVLAVCAVLRSRLAELVAMSVLAVVSAVSDSRSAASILLLAAVLVVWQLVQRTAGLRSSTARAFVTLVLTAVLALAALQAFLLSGLFGESAMERTAAQLEASGSVIAGGRPELGATLALLGQDPAGYGSGTLPTLGDILVAKTGMESLRYDANNGYVENYLFGNGFEVHSVIGDLWIRFGPVGAAFVIVVVVGIMVGVTRKIATHEASALLLFLMVQVVWDLLFSPFFSTSIATLMLAAALALPRTAPRPARDAERQARAPVRAGQALSPT